MLPKNEDFGGRNGDAGGPVLLGPDGHFVHASCKGPVAPLLLPAAQKALVAPGDPSSGEHKIHPKKNKNNRTPKKMSGADEGRAPLFLLMTPTAHLPVHGQPYAAPTLLPFLEVYPLSWLARASAPHVCGVAGCALMRETVLSLWARVARRAARRAARLVAARLALARTFPRDIASYVLALL